MKATTARPEVQFMEEYLQRLRQYLTQGGLTAVDARDGMVAAYLVISRLNQLQGNSDVGLKQDEPGLYQHFSGFLGAIFWERGYNYDHPTVQQLGEVKMMLDGTAQIFAMPENLQMALNEICDFLLARAGNQPAVVSSAVMDLLESHTPAAVPVSPDIANYDFSAPKIAPEPEVSAAPEPAPAPEPAHAEPVAAEPARAAQPPSSVEVEPDLVALFDEAMREETPPAVAPEPEAAPVFEIVEGAPRAETPAVAGLPAELKTSAPQPEAEPSRFGLEPEKAEAPAGEAPAEPVKKKRGRKKSVETAEPKPKAVRKKAKTTPAPVEAEAPAPVASEPQPLPVAAVETELAAAVPASDTGETEPVTQELEPAAPAGLHEDEKLSWTMFGAMPAEKIAENPEPAETPTVVAESADTGEPAPVPEAVDNAELPQTAAVTWETDTAVLDSEVQASPSSVSELGSFSEAAPEVVPASGGYAAELVSEPSWTPPAEEVVSAPVAYGASEEVVSAPRPAAAEEEVVSAPVSRDLNEEVVSAPAPSYGEAAPAPVPAPSPWSEPEPVPAARPAQPSYQPAAEPAWSGRTSAERAEEYADTPPPAKGGWGAPLAVGLVLGLVLGGVAAYLVAGNLASSDAASAKTVSDKQLALAKADADKAKAEADKMRAAFKEQEAAWRKTPDKPAHLKIGQGVLLYWPNEGMMRKYYVYRGKGPAGNMLKVTEEPLDINFLYLSRMEAGSWRFAVSALTKEGVETDRGEPATLAFPLK